MRSTASGACARRSRDATGDVARAIYASITQGRPAHDDVAILAVTFHQPLVALDGPRRASVWGFDSTDALGSGPRAPRVHRPATCGGSQRRRDVSSAELVFGELVGNVVRYAPGAITVMLDVSGAGARAARPRRRPRLRVPAAPAGRSSLRARARFVPRDRVRRGAVGRTAARRRQPRAGRARRAYASRVGGEPEPRRRALSQAGERPMTHGGSSVVVQCVPRGYHRLPCAGASSGRLACGTPRSDVRQTTRCPSCAASGRYLAEGLAAGEGAVVIATEAHREAFLAELAQRSAPIRRPR